MRPPRAAHVVLLAAIATACGSRISLGSLADGTLPDDAPVDVDLPSPDAPGIVGPDAATSPDDASIEDPDAHALDAGSPWDGGWYPCLAKACGERCKLCPPGEPNCFETAVLKACSAAGECLTAPTVCP